MNKIDVRAKLRNIRKKYYTAVIFCSELSCHRIYCTQHVAQQFTGLLQKGSLGLFIALASLLHDQNTPEPGLAAHHVFICLLRILQRELFNHAFYAAQLSEGNSLLAVERCSTRPSMHGLAFENHAVGVEGNGPASLNCISPEQLMYLWRSERN